MLNAFIIDEISKPSTATTATSSTSFCGRCCCCDSFFFSSLPSFARRVSSTARSISDRPIVDLELDTVPAVSTTLQQAPTVHSIHAFAVQPISSFRAPSAHGVPSDPSSIRSIPDHFNAGRRWVVPGKSKVSPSSSNGSLRDLVDEDPGPAVTRHRVLLVKIIKSCSTTVSFLVRVSLHG